MNKYNVTLYAAVNRYKLREALNLFSNDIDADGDGCYELIATIDNPNYVYYPTIRRQEE